jgi:predicted RNA-binding protein with EMAP domain
MLITPCPTKDVLNMVLQNLSRRKQIESTCKDLKQNLQALKYPYLQVKPLLICI